MEVDDGHAVLFDADGVMGGATVLKVGRQHTARKKIDPPIPHFWPVGDKILLR